MRVTRQQTNIAHALLTTFFVEGVAGTGKTTAGVRRLRYLVERGIPAGSILVLVPQRALAFPYEEEIRRLKQAGGGVTIGTIGSLSLQMVDLFWPLVSEEAQFGHPLRRPTFLSLELVQYFMARILGPVIEERDYFNSVRIDRNRLYSQIVDNLNKASVVGFPYETIGERLKAAWTGEPTQRFIYDDTQDCVNQFREHCRQNNLLDFSYQIELFVRHLWPMEAPRRYLTQKYRHLIVDNVEEDNPATHRILTDWLDLCESALILYDTGGGYRSFLGSDAINAYKLKERCRNHVVMTKTHVMSPDMQALNSDFEASLMGVKSPEVKKSSAKKPEPIPNIRAAIVFPEDAAERTYTTDTIAWTAKSIASLVNDYGVPPKEIVVLAPLLSDALRFSLTNRLEALKIPVYAHRPSRALRQEPAARALLTLAKIAHPDWGMKPPSFDVTYALMSAIHGLDLARARLLSEIVYRQTTGGLSSFEKIFQDKQSRITFELGGRYETLFRWLEAYQKEDRPPLDYFFSRLFGEALSQPGFGFHQNFDAARAAANLIDSARNFRWTVSTIDPEADIGQEYVRMVDNGVIADQYLRDWELSAKDSVLLAPAYTYLMSNRPVDYQFWLNIGSPAWAQRLYQPLTHPYVLSLQWDEKPWTFERDEATNRETLNRLVTGLVRRCRKRIYLGYSQYGEQGYEQRGPLLETVQRILKRSQMEVGDAV